jgi:threonine/homoserine/homoserine lactone efflux protein
MMAIQLAWFSSVVMLLSQPKINEKFQRLGHWIDRILGGTMILIGLKILTSKIN